MKSPELSAEIRRVIEAIAILKTLVKRSSATSQGLEIQMPIACDPAQL